MSYNMISQRYAYTGTPGSPYFVLDLITTSNIPYGYTEVSVDQAKSLANQHLQAMKTAQAAYSSAKSKGERYTGITPSEQDIQNWEKRISSIGSESKDQLVAEYTAPWGEKLTNIPLSQIQAIEQSQADLKSGKMIDLNVGTGKPPMLVPKGTQTTASTTAPSSKVLGNVVGSQGYSANDQGISNLYSTVAPGQRSEQVRQLQQALINAGYSIPAGATGYYGDQTEAALTQWKSGLQNKTTTSTAGTAGGTTGGTTSYSTGVPELDAMLEQMQNILKTNEAAGMIVNPNIELTPAEIQAFYDQAETQIDPYYKSQFAAVKKDLVDNLSYLQKQYDLKKQEDEATFKSNLASSRENASGRGTVFSGTRGQTEQGLVSSQGRTLQSEALTLENQLQQGLTSAEREIGSSNLSGLQLPTYQTYSPTLTGKGSFTPGRTLSFGLTGGVTGTSEYTKRREARELGDYLAQQESKKRSLNIY